MLKEKDEGKLSSLTTSFSTEQMHFLLPTSITITRFQSLFHFFTLQMSEEEKSSIF